MTDTPPIDVPQRVNRWPSVLWSVLTLAMVGVTGLTFVAVAARMHWAFDLATHFRVYYVGAFVLLSGAFAIGRQWKRAALCALFLAWNVAPIAAGYVRRSEGSSGGPLVRCLLANVLTSNRSHNKLLELVRRENPDVILLLETDQSWLDAVADLRANYPHFREVARSDNFGIAFFSRLPIVLAEITELGDSGLPAIVARLKQAEQSITFIGLHTLPPVGARNSSIRNRQLAAAAELASGMSGPVALMGDLNITPWSPYFSDLLSRSVLKDSRDGFGIQPTWTARRRIFRIPIDHVLVSREIEVEDRRVGPNIGSDHFPVIVDLAVPP